MLHRLSEKPRLWRQPRETQCFHQRLRHVRCGNEAERDGVSTEEPQYCRDGSIQETTRRWHLL